MRRRHVFLDDDPRRAARRHGDRASPRSEFSSLVSGRSVSGLGYSGLRSVTVLHHRTRKPTAVSPSFERRVGRFRPYLHQGTDPAPRRACLPRHSLPGETVRIRDERWVVTRPTPGINASVLEVRGRDRSNLDARASFLLPFEIVERLASDRSPRRVRPGRWRQLTRAILAEATPSWPSLRTPLRARISLLPFQLEPALAVTHGVASRILIADEVGLGKTIQAALIIAESSRTNPPRRGCSSSLQPRSGSSGSRSSTIGSPSTRGLPIRRRCARLGAAWGTPNPWAGRPVTITSIDFVKRPEVMRALEALVWDAVVFDEAHGLTGHSDRARCGRSAGAPRANRRPAHSHAAFRR